MEILFGIIGISIPIFYFWGLFRFLGKVFGNNDASAQQKRPDYNAQAPLLLKLMQSARENPDMTLGEFLAEVRSATEPTADEEISLFDELDEDSQDEVSARLGDLVSTPRRSEPVYEEPAPAFSFSNWYQENTVDFILYLGAFLIVAAVSLFVSFQWEQLGGIARFAIVLSFTIAWFIAGGAVRRILKLENVGLIFVTIGAVLVPFNGIAWQQFVVGSDAGLGLTWLITASAALVVYMTLTLIYRRRYFTYFGNLSILAMVLSLVQINNAPQEYFILAGAFTSLLMLFGRLGMRANPAIDDYFGIDFERSSLGIIGVSVLGGLSLLGTTDIPFFSVQVLAVLITTLVYVWVYNTLHFNAVTIGISQLVTVGTVAHALITFDIDPTITVILVTVANISLQFALNYWLQDEHPTLYKITNALSFAMSIMLYVMCIVVDPLEMLPIVGSLTLMLHSMFAAHALSRPALWNVSAFMQYLIVGHILTYFADSGNEEVAIAIFLMLGTVQTLVMFAPLPKAIRSAYTSAGLVGATLFGIFALLVIQPDDPLLYIKLTQTLLPFGLYALVMLTQLRASDNERISGHISAYMMALGSIAFYFCVAALYSFDIPALPILYAGFAGGIIWLISEYTDNPRLTYAVYLTPYAMMWHALEAFNLPSEAYPIATTLISYSLFFSPLPEKAVSQRRLTSIIVLAVVAFLAFSIALEDEIMSMHLAGWVSSYGVMGLLVASRSLLTEQRNLYDSLIVVASLLQYYWHVIFAALFISADIFNDVQWYSAAPAAICLAAAIRLQLNNPDDEKDDALAFHFLGAGLLMLPTLAQIINQGDLIYFALGILYALAVAGLGISFDIRRLRTVGAISLVLVVLAQTSEFLIALPRWLIVGVVGFGLLGAGLFLALRNRNTPTEQPVPANDDDVLFDFEE